MATILNFEDLEIWKEARALNKNVYHLIQNSKAITTEYRFKEQIKSACGCVMDNIAEGFERNSRLEFVNFLSIAKGSIGEIRSQLIRGLDMKFWDEDAINHIKIIKKF